MAYCMGEPTALGNVVYECSLGLDTHYLWEIASEVLTWGAAALLLVSVIFAIPFALQILRTFLPDGGSGDRLAAKTAEINAEYEYWMGDAKANYTGAERQAREDDINREFGRPY